MNWTSLIQQKYAPDAFIHGQYFVIKFMPDVVAREVFNLGVGFFQDNDPAIRYRLLDNSLKGFNCIYGSEAVSGMRLLLKSVAQALDTVGIISPPSPQISYTQPIAISGLSVESIMDTLYRDHVHMDHFVQKRNRKPTIVNTADLRKGVHDYLAPPLRDKYYREDKIWLKSDVAVDEQIAVDLPIWRPKQDNLFDIQPLFASIVSADYVEREALSYNLDFLGCTNIQNACSLLGPESKAGLFIYRPTLNERVTPNKMDEIDSHIDNSLYILERMKKKGGYDINIEVMDSQYDIYAKVKSFITT